MQTKSGKINSKDLNTLAKVDISSCLRENLISNNELSSSFVESIVDVLIDTLKSKKSILLTGVGTLSLNYKSARSGVRNPQTGEEFVVPEGYVVKLGKNNGEVEKLNTSSIIQLIFEKYNGSVKLPVITNAFKLFRECIKVVGNGDERIEIRGLGVFYPSVRMPYVGRNPKTGESVNVPKKIKVMFQCSDLILEHLNG